MTALRNGLILVATTLAFFAQGVHAQKAPDAHNPTFDYSPAPLTTVTFPTVAVGATASAQISVSVGPVSNASATRTRGITGTPDCTTTGPFSFVRLADTTPATVDSITISNATDVSGTLKGSIDLTCLAGALAGTGTLSCSQTISSPPGGVQPPNVTWDLNCPAGTPAGDTPPTLTYLPAQDADGNPDGTPEVVLTGSGTASGSITVTAAGQSGTGSVGLSCVGAGGTSIVGGTPQTISTNGPQTSLSLQCTTGGSAVIGTLTCTETDSPGGAMGTGVVNVEIPAPTNFLCPLPFPKKKALLTDS